MNNLEPIAEVRLDKWLWAARFFKTRHLAVEAINGGKVEVNGTRAKPGRGIRPGARVCVHKDSLKWEVEVLAVTLQRRPAAEAARLYAEDETSLGHRLEQLRQRSAAGPLDQSGERPTKRDRRQLDRFKDETAR